MKNYSKLLLLLLMLVFLTGCKTDPKEYQMETIANKITPDMVEAKYLLSIQTQTAFCEVYINGIPVFDNYRIDSGTIVTSVMASPFLENGENEIELLFTPFDSDKGIKEHREGALCDLRMTANFPDETIELTSITATAQKNGLPTSALSKDYPNKHKTSPVEEVGYATDDALDYTMKRTITLQNLPEWAWTNATPLPDSSETYKMLQDAYIKLGLMFQNSDLNSFKKTVWLAMQERAVADLLDPEYYFETTDFPDYFSKGVSHVPVSNWSDYKLKLYKGGKLARLVNQYDIPPLEFKRPDGRIHYYNCCFSLIDGKLVISR